MAVFGMGMNGLQGEDLTRSIIHMHLSQQLLVGFELMHANLINHRYDLHASPIHRLIGGRTTLLVRERRDPILSIQINIQFITIATIMVVSLFNRRSAKSLHGEHMMEHYNISRDFI